MCDSSMLDELFNTLGGYIYSLDSSEEALISVLHQAQESFGYIPVEVEEFIAETMDIPIVRVNSVVSYYSFFARKPKGRYPINVCTGGSCYLNGSTKVINALKRELGIDVGETTEDKRFSIDVLKCEGACGKGPIITIDNKTYCNVNPKKISSILDEYK